MSLIDLEINGLGAGGDGVSRTPEGMAFVPMALPGERWQVRRRERVEGGWRAEPVQLLAGGERATPPCPHFGRCGGCRLQHLPDPLYRRFKLDRVRSALARRGLHDVPIAEPIEVPPGSRRRLRLALAGRPGRLRLGFRQRHSHAVEPVAVCPIARPELVALLAPLAAGLSDALAAPLPAEASLILTETGADLLLRADRSPSLAERESLAALAQRLDLARLGWKGRAAPPEALAERRRPVVSLAGIPVELPLGGFLQATVEGERALAVAVQAWGGGAAQAVDLYGGLGTLGLPLACRGTRVHTVEAAAAPLAALRQAATRHRLPVTVEARDLARRPLAASDLGRFDLALLDPPRAGALTQARELARSAVPRIVMAACDPGTFARDARVLVDGGYRLLGVRPIDQFLWSAEIELVAHLTR